MSWKKEEKIIEGLSKLYPKFETEYGCTIQYKKEVWGNAWKAWWVACLCVYHLNQRILSLEEFMRIHNNGMWRWYVTMVQN